MTSNARPELAQSPRWTFASHRARRVLTIATVLTVGAACRNVSGQAKKPRATAQALQPAARRTVSPATGPSWLKHLRLSLDSAKLGQQGGSEGPPETAATEPTPTPATMDVVFVVTGADVYRYSCRGCHGPGGGGAAEEIPSLIPFLEATSPTLLAARMKEQGHPASEKLMGEIAANAEVALKDRLHKGGTKMPPFAYLESDEVASLISYLKELIHAPIAERRSQPLREPALRVGELLAKGTCHVCHDATGPGNPHLTMMQGVIPSLESFASAYDQDQVLRKVQLGTTGGMMMMHGPGKMPRYPYLTHQEVAAAYGYLAKTRPQPADQWPAVPSSP